MTDPAWAYEKAELRSYDVRWPDRARVECARLVDLLGPWASWSWRTYHLREPRAAQMLKTTPMARAADASST